MAGSEILLVWTEHKVQLRMATGRLLWLARQSGTLARSICRIHTLLQTTSDTCWKHFRCQCTSAISPLNALWRFALQIIILLTYLHRSESNMLTCGFNSLPTHLKDYNLSLAVLKRRLKSYFLTRHNLKTLRRFALITLPHYYYYYKLKERKRNTEIRDHLGWEPVRLVTKKGRLRWFGYAECKDNPD